VSVAYRLIVVGTDNSADADAALEFAGELARSAPAPLHIVAMHHSYPDTFCGSQLRAAHAMGHFDGLRCLHEPTEARIVEIHRTHIEQYAQRLRRRGIDVSIHVVSGDPANRLTDLATELGADLVVVGAHGLHGRRRRFSSVAVSVVRAAKVPVLVVPASGGSTGLSWA
jgi:nucleotide-binding universal stress UspA family protein